MSPQRLDQLPPGPILLVADNEAIASCARTWAAAFKAAGRPYRVRLAGPSTPGAINAEARSLGAVALIWAGNQDTRDLSTSAAHTLAIPLAHAAVLNHA